jgi:hypothetical protein
MAFLLLIIGSLLNFLDGTKTTVMEIIESGMRENIAKNALKNSLSF